jgi:hypothetical protein
VHRAESMGAKQVVCVTGKLIVAKATAPILLLVLHHASRQLYGCPHICDNFSFGVLRFHIIILQNSTLAPLCFSSLPVTMPKIGGLFTPDASPQSVIRGPKARSLTRCLESFDECPYPQVHQSAQDSEIVLPSQDVSVGANGETKSWLNGDRQERDAMVSLGLFIDERSSAHIPTAELSHSPQKLRLTNEVVQPVDDHVITRPHTPMSTGIAMDQSGVRTPPAQTGRSEFWAEFGVQQWLNSTNEATTPHTTDYTTLFKGGFSQNFSALHASAQRIHVDAGPRVEPPQITEPFVECNKLEAHAQDIITTDPNHTTNSGYFSSSNDLSLGDAVSSTEDGSVTEDVSITEDVSTSEDDGETSTRVLILELLSLLQAVQQSNEFHEDLQVDQYTQQSTTSSPPQVDGSGTNDPSTQSSKSQSPPNRRGTKRTNQGSSGRRDEDEPSRKKSSDDRNKVILDTLISTSNSIQMPCPLLEAHSCQGTNATISELLRCLLNKHRIIVCKECCSLLAVSEEERRLENVLKKHTAEGCEPRCIGSSCASMTDPVLPHHRRSESCLSWKALPNETKWTYIWTLVNPGQIPPSPAFQCGIGFEHNTERRPCKTTARTRGTEICATLLRDAETKDRQISLLEENLRASNDRLAQLEQRYNEKSSNLENIIETLLERLEDHKINIPRSLRNRLQAECPNVLNESIIAPTSSLSPALPTPESTPKKSPTATAGSTATSLVTCDSQTNTQRDPPRRVIEETIDAAVIEQPHMNFEACHASTLGIGGDPSLGATLDLSDPANLLDFLRFDGGFECR